MPRVVVDAEPDTVAICHCQICQRRTGVPLTCNAYFPKSKVRLEGEHRIYTRDVRRGANCTTTSAQPAVQRSAGLSICVQITLVSRLGASTTGISRLRWRRSGRRRCALGQCCQRAFSISRALDRLRARVKRFHVLLRRMRPEVGTSRQFAATQHFGRFRSEADVHRGVASTVSVADEPRSRIDRTEIPQCGWIAAAAIS
jgi:hypothetical protein